MKDTFLVLHKLAEEHRLILTPWRAHILLRRHKDPHFTAEAADRVMRQLLNAGMIESVEGRLYRVVMPYAPSTINVYELANEGYYSGGFCYSTALEIHRLTDQRSSTLHLFIPPAGEKKQVQVTTKRGADNAANDPIPPGTRPGEWRLIPLPGYSRIKEFEGVTIETHSLKEEWWFGFVEMPVEGVAVRVTDLERTLIDGLRFPKYCGGLNEVFLAWVRALERISTEIMVEYVERIGQSILFQRAGFVMEMLGLTHPRFEVWKREHVARGGSRRLDPEAPYSATYDETWQISLNHPTDILANREAFFS